MSITLTKALPAKAVPSGDEMSYTLHIKTVVQVNNPGQTVVDMPMYESKECFDSGYYPMLHKQHNITNATVCSLVYENYESNYPTAIQAIETFLVQNDPWYQGGQVVLETR